MDDGDAIIPQWAIAVIVIGVGGLLFIIVFGVSVVSIEDKDFVSLYRILNDLLFTITDLIISILHSDFSSHGFI